MSEAPPSQPGTTSTSIRTGPSPRPAAADPSHAGEHDATLYLHPQTLSRLGTFELRAKMIVEGVMSGMHRSPYKGFSVEFAQHRPYVAGDDLRHLDWKVYGRSDKLYLKQYEQETSLDLVVLVDASGSMNYGSRLFSEASGQGVKTSPSGQSEWTKYDHATATAAAYAYMALRQGDRVGLGIFADALIDAADRTSASSQWRKIVNILSKHPVGEASDIGRVIDQTLAKLNNRCLIVLVSDFFEDPQRLRTALARIKHHRHDVILSQIVDQQEREFRFTDAAPFEGLEGEGRVRLDPRAIRSAYCQAFEEHLDTVEKLARSFGFDYQLVDTHGWLGPSLASFVSRRNAILKRTKAG